MLETLAFIVVVCFALGATGIFLYGAVEAVRAPLQKAARAASVAGARVFSNLRMLMFGWEFPPHNSGGLGVATLGIVNALAKKNTDVTLVLPKKLSVHTPYARIVCDSAPYIRTHAINSPLSPYLSTGSYAKASDGSPLYGESLISEVHRYGVFGETLSKQEPHDIIYAHDWLSFPAGIKAKRASGKPLVVHMHATEFDRTSNAMVNQDVYDIERRGMHAADRIIAVSGRTKKTIVERYGIPEEKVHVVHNGIDESTAPVTPITQRLSKLKESGYDLVLFMGRLTLQKGPDYFLRAAAKVLTAHPKTFFIIAGSGDMERTLIEEAARLNIAHRVLFPGFLRGAEQSEAYAAADLFVMPSVSEPFGLTALEAMRAGTPVIISKQSGVGEATPSALQVDFWDVDKMAELIVSTLENPEQKVVLSAKGKDEAGLLTWERTALSIRDIVDDVIHMSRGALPA